MFTLLLFACSGESEKDTAVQLNLGPTVSHTVPSDRLVEGDSLALSVAVKDDDGVAEVTLYYRTKGALYWDDVSIWSDGYETEVTVDTAIDELSAPGVEYYFKATDQNSSPAYSFYPEKGPEEPLAVEVAPTSVALPFFEDFEFADGETTLMDLDWWTPSDGRDTYAFYHSGSKPYSGMYSIYHPSGDPVVPELSDWLISPPLNFSDQSGVMVSWWEAGYSVTENSLHGLYVSTGSRLPEDGDFVEVEDISLPIGSDYARHRYVDLSPWAGEPLVYVAWRWQGTMSDEWYIDDVTVRPLGPDFSSVVAYSPDPLTPGDVVQFTVDFDNLTKGTADELSLSISLPDGGGTLANDQLQLGAVAGEETITAQFSMTLDTDVDPNRYLPLELSLTDGVDTWSFAHQLLIGQVSTAELQIEALQEANVDISVGYGDPAAPLWSTTLYAGAVAPGPTSFDTDITEHFAYLPPQAGENRWYVSVAATGLVNVSQFAIGYGGEQFVNSNFATVFDGQSAVVYLPEPPQPQVLQLTPVSMSPGDIDVPVSLYLSNVGNATQGPVIGRLYSNETDVTITNGDDFVVDADSWERNESTYLTGPTISLDGSHTNSVPINLFLELSDTIESWIVPLEIDVPWPVLQVTGVTISDDGGNGLLDPDENAELELTVTNVGDLGSFGYVYANLVVEESSTAMATVVNDDPKFGFLGSGESETEDEFLIMVSEGSAGDKIDLLLELDDGTQVYSDRFQLILGEAPWFSLSAFPDNIGDVLSSADVDLLSADYRVMGDRFELRIESANVIDPASAFIEIWAQSGGSNYVFYRWVLQSGNGTMEGYLDGQGFTPIGDVDVRFEGDHQVVLGWNISDMSLSQNSITMGLASGWCGPPVYFCDQYPDGWGWPWVSYTNAAWMTATF